jgi:hypothetical protein
MAFASHKIHKSFIATLAVGAAMAGYCLSPPAQAGSFSAGISVSDEIRGDETGLAVYPGARLHRDKRESQDKSGAVVDLGFGPWGLKVRVAKFVSNDSPESISEFYKRELGRYGQVLDCTHVTSGVDESKEERRARIAKQRQERRERNERNAQSEPTSNVLSCAINNGGANISVSDRTIDSKLHSRFLAGLKNDRRDVVISKASSDGQTEFVLVHIATRSPD